MSVRIALPLATGGAGYGKRFASTVGWSVIHSTLAFGLDTALRQDPRYYRSGAGGLRRVGHALRGTMLTRTDSGGVRQDSLAPGFDFAGNPGHEFVPDVKRKVFRRK